VVWLQEFEGGGDGRGRLHKGGLGGGRLGLRGG
jgi:hypothetical protein